MYKVKNGIRNGRWYWDYEYVEDTIPTVFNYNEGKLEGKVIEYDAKPDFNTLIQFLETSLN